MTDLHDKLAKKGWAVGDTQDFLGMSDEEMRLVEFRIALGKMLRKRREAHGYTQTVFAGMAGTSQSRLAKMEAGDSSVTIDLILKALFRLATREEVCAGLMGAE